MSIKGVQVEGNSNHMSDGHLGGSLHVYERNHTLQSKKSNKKRVLH